MNRDNISGQRGERTEKATTEMLCEKSLENPVNWSVLFSVITEQSVLVINVICHLVISVGRYATPSLYDASLITTVAFKTVREAGLFTRWHQKFPRANLVSEKKGMNKFRFLW